VGSINLPQGRLLNNLSELEGEPEVPDLHQFTKFRFGANKIKVGEVLQYGYQFTTLTCGTRPQPACRE